MRYDGFISKTAKHASASSLSIQSSRDLYILFILPGCGEIGDACTGCYLAGFACHHVVYLPRIYFQHEARSFRLRKNLDCVLCLTRLDWLCHFSGQRKSRFAHRRNGSRCNGVNPDHHDDDISREKLQASQKTWWPVVTLAFSRHIFLNNRRLDIWDIILVYNHPRDDYRRRGKNGS